MVGFGVGMFLEYHWLINGADSWFCLLCGWTGLDGCLIADMGETGQEYDTSWRAKGSKELCLADIISYYDRESV